jgi:polar amino acid transport system substrate-binding protein
MPRDNQPRTSWGPLGVAVTALAIAVTVAACGGGGDGGSSQTDASAATPASKSTTASASATSSTLENARKRGFITIGFANEKPYSYATSDGKLKGEAVAILNYVLPKIGIKSVQGTLTEFDSLIPGLVAKRFDMIAAGMAIRAERCQQIDFGNPDNVVGDGFAVKSGNPKNLHSYDDIAKGDAKLGVFAGTAEVDNAAAAGIPKSRVLVFPDTASALAGLRSGRIDAFAATSLAINASLNSLKDKSLEMASPFKDPVDSAGHPKVFFQGMGFRKDDGELRDAYNAELEKIRQDGTLLKLMKPYGFTTVNLPPDGLATAEICKFAQ